MRKPTRFSVAMLIPAAALFAAMSAPSVFAEHGHGGRDGGRVSDDVVTTAATVDDNHVSDDRGVDAVVTISAPVPVATVVGS
jgi:hypothetical protein